MRRLWRKDRIFRFYLGGYVVVSSALVWFFFRSVESSHKREVSALLDRVEASEKRPVASASSASPEEAKAEEQKQETTSSPPPPLFYVEGTGQNGRWAYMDIAFLDGARRRYYFRPYPSRRELAELHRRLEHDANLHYYYVDESSES